MDQSSHKSQAGHQQCVCVCMVEGGQCMSVHYKNKRLLLSEHEVWIRPSFI